MDRSGVNKLRALLTKIYNNKSNFYQNKYKNAGFKKADINKINFETLYELPSVTLEELARASYKTRKLSEEIGFNKLVFSKKANLHFLIHRNLSEIKKSSLPIEGERPMVLMQNVYEAIESCLFLYENKILPLIGEFLNPAVVYATAKQYDIDALYTDHESSLLFKDGLQKLKLKIKSITIVDNSMHEKDMEWPKNSRVHFVLSLPEFGGIAYACEKKVNKKLHLHAYKDVLIEPGDKAVLTSTRLNACPMIRYLSELNIRAIKDETGCNVPAFVLNPGD